MINEPLFKSVPTYRNYEDYHDAEQYTRGWNDAICFIFVVDKNRDEHCQHGWKEMIAKSRKEADDDSSK